MLTDKSHVPLTFHPMEKDVLLPISPIETVSFTHQSEPLKLEDDTICNPNNKISSPFFHIRCTPIVDQCKKCLDASESVVNLLVLRQRLPPTEKENEFIYRIYSTRGVSCCSPVYQASDGAHNLKLSFTKKKYALT